jgi:hypothetical protein
MSVCYRFTLSIAVVVGPAPLWCRLIVSCLVSSAGIEDFVSHSAILVQPPSRLPRIVVQSVP